ncbi:MAG TPA: GNAT family N-acetyltransferase [Jiangellaceae bacterium]
MSVEIRDCVVDDLDAALDVRTRSFGPISASAAEQWRSMQERAIDEGRLLAAYDGRRLVAISRITAFRQWWHGEAMPMAGIGGVVVAPEYRGSGVGRQLMTSTLRRAADHGYPLSALYPTTAPPYRAVGFELAGRQHFVTAPSDAVRTIAPASRVAVRRVGPDDVAGVMATVGRVHARHLDCGPIEWPSHDVAEWLGEDETFAYLADDGFVAYRWDGSKALAVDVIVGESADTVRSLWALVGSGSSVARTIRACVPPDDSVRLLTRDLTVTTEKDVWWLLRVVDAPAAVAARGFPRGVEVGVPVTVADPLLTDNSGDWLMQVKDGRGQLVPGNGGGLGLTANGLAALFAGTRVSRLRQAGLATGGDPGLDGMLDAAFAATAFMLDYF